MPDMEKNNILLYADSESSADMLYFSDIFIPDPFIALKIKHKTIGLFNALEYTRASKESSLNTILPLEEYQEKAKKHFKTTKPTVGQIIAILASEYKTKNFTIPDNFPARVAFDLQNLGLTLLPSKSGLFPKREIKDAPTAKLIKEGNAASTAGIEAAYQALKEANIKGNRLYLDNKPLTSERLRTLVNIACLERGAIPKDTIVAGGNQACDPHCRGSGPLRPNELIIIDVFPRIEKTGYHGDMTRTLLKGIPSDAQSKLVKTVQKAQKLALSQLKAGVTGDFIHKHVQDFFQKENYVTQKIGNTHEGFFHGTGHGLGLEVHETPRINPNAPRLKSGQVVTIEPGLYYPGLGGCRIEDVAWIQENGYELLSKCHYRWLIP